MYIFPPDAKAEDTLMFLSNNIKYPLLNSQRLSKISRRSLADTKDER